MSAIAGVVMVALSLYFSARFGIRNLYLAGALAYLLVPVLAQLILRPAPSGHSADPGPPATAEK